MDHIETFNLKLQIERVQLLTDNYRFPFCAVRRQSSKVKHGNLARYTIEYDERFIAYQASVNALSGTFTGQSAVTAVG